MSVSLYGSGQTVVQVIQTTLTSTFSSTSSTYVDVTGLAATITPLSTSNKILVRVDMSGSAASLSVFQLVRNSTAIALGDASGSHTQSTTSCLQYSGTNGDRGFYGGFQWLDSPATTSAITYKVQGYADTGQWNINRTASDANTNYGPRSVSTITLMEIAYV
jgi:hypothetical protein